MFVHTKGKSSALLAIYLLLISACGANGDHAVREDERTDAATISIHVAPESATVPVADGVQSNPGKQQFSVVLEGTANTAVRWEICSESTCFDPGHWNQYGSITEEGLYTAPLVLPNPPTLRVRASSVTDPDISASAAVTIDRNVVWRVTTDRPIDSAPPDWDAMITPGDHEVFYHIFHDGAEERCKPSDPDAAIGPCYRQVIFHVGKGYRPGNGAVFFFHGANGDLSACSGWKSENDRHGWITVCIQGVATKSSRSWNAYWPARHGIPAPQEIAPDDSGLAWAIGRDLVDHLRVSPRRIHATGHSAGDLMLVRLLAENGPQMASIAQITGNMYGTDHPVCIGEDETCNPPSRFPQAHEFPPFGFGIPNLNYPVSVLSIMGTADRYTPLCGAHNNSPNIDEDVRIYADSFHCATLIPDSNPFCPFVAGQSPRCQESKFVPGSGRACAPGGEIYKHATDCDNGVVIQAYSLLNGVHRWEANDISDSSLPIHNPRFRADFPAATPPNGSGSQHAIVWDFFNRHPKP